jgi:hypothetical protein
VSEWLLAGGWRTAQPAGVNRGACSCVAHELHWDVYAALPEAAVHFSKAVQQQLLRFLGLRSNVKPLSYPNNACLALGLLPAGSLQALGGRVWCRLLTHLPHQGR